MSSDDLNSEDASFSSTGIDEVKSMLEIENLARNVENISANARIDNEIQERDAAGRSLPISESNCDISDDVETETLTDLFHIIVQNMGSMDDNFLSEHLTEIEIMLNKHKEGTTRINFFLMSEAFKLLNMNKFKLQLRFRFAKILMLMDERKTTSLDGSILIDILIFIISNFVDATDEHEWCREAALKITSKADSNRTFSPLFEVNKSTIIQAMCSVLEKEKFLSTPSLVQPFVRNFMTHTELLWCLNEALKKHLIYCPINEATDIGKIYYRLWAEADDPDIKQYITLPILDSLLENAIEVGRQQPTVITLHKNLHKVMSVLHESRKDISFSRTITELHNGILWSRLTSANNVERANAADLLMDVYPMEVPRAGKANYSMNLRRQHNAMITLLSDKCPTIRCIAIKGVFANMKYFWVTFLNGSFKEIMQKMVSLSKDVNSFAVRRAVFDGLSQLLDEPRFRPHMPKLITLLKQSFHDKNASVRRAFLRMLLKLRDIDCPPKYHEVVGIVDIVNRLGIESRSNQALMVKLIFPSFVNKHLTEKMTVQRLCKFISYDSDCVQYVAQYSVNLIPIESVTKLISFILTALKNKAAKKLKYKNMQESTDSVSDTVAGSEKMDVDNESQSSDDGSSSNAISIAHGLLNFVAVFWLTHTDEYTKEENKGYIQALYKRAALCIPTLARYYGGTRAFYGVLNVAAMIPLSTLSSVSTIIGVCLSTLKKNNPADEMEIGCIINALCLWNRGEEVLELVQLILNEVFRSIDLNETKTYENSIPASLRSKKRVKFSSVNYKLEQIQLAAVIFNKILNSQTIQRMFFKKNGVQIREFWDFLERILDTIEHRIEKGYQMSDLMDDDFITTWFNKYGHVLYLLGLNEIQDFDFWSKFIAYLQRCQGFVNSESTLDQNTEKVIIAVLNSSLNKCTNVIAVGSQLKCTEQNLSFMINYCNSLLNSKYKTDLINSSVLLLRQVVDFSYTFLFNNSKANVLLMDFPLLYQKVWTVFCEATSIKPCQSMVSDTFKNSFRYIFMKLLQMFPECENTPVLYIMKITLEKAIDAMRKNYIEMNTIYLNDSFDNLPLVANFVGLIFFEKTEVLKVLFYHVVRNIFNTWTTKDDYGYIAAVAILFTSSYYVTEPFTCSTLRKTISVAKERISELFVSTEILEILGNANFNNNDENIDKTVIDEPEYSGTMKNIATHIVCVTEKRIRNMAFY